MANLLQSSQTQATTAPDYYSNYLSNLATQGQQAATGAQYVGAQPLQEQAFQNVSGAASAFKPTLEAAGSTLGSAAGSASPLSAAAPYLQSASGDIGESATGLMSPYTQNVVNALGEAGQRNIMQNLAPQATAGAVGSGQFGSKRGAEVLGQTIANANKDIQNQQYQALNTGYNTALQTALGQKQLEGTLGSTAGQLQSAGQQNLTQAGQAQGQLASTNQALNLADINALSTLGGQQQTIAQNQQLFPLTNLSTLSGILRGYNVPTSTSTTMNMSPLSALAGAGAGTVGMFTPGAGGKTPWENMKTAYDKMTSPSTPEITPSTSGGGDYTGGIASDATSVGTNANGVDVYYSPSTGQYTDSNGAVVDVLPDENLAEGGSVGSWITSFAPHLQRGGLPAGSMPQYDQSNTYVGYNDTDGNLVKQ